MKNLIAILGVMWLSACTLAPDGRARPADDPAELASTAEEASELAGGETNLIRACHTRTPCFTADVPHLCGAWTTPRKCGGTSCGGPCGPRCQIGDPDDPGASCTFAILQPTEVSRLCEDAAGNTCVEFASGGNVSGGCGLGICGGEPIEP